MAHEIFISYASADKQLAERVCAALEGAGRTCWIAPRDIEPGADYPAAIVQAVAGARLLVLILTAQAAASPHIRSEVGHAFNGRKRIIPFRVSTEPLTGDLEYFLSLTQWLDAPGGATEENLKRLLEAVAATPARTLHQRQERKRRTIWIAAAGASLALAAGAVIVWKPAPAPAPLPAAAPGPTATAPAPTAEPAKLKTWLNPADGLTYVWIPPGTFVMGCSPGDSECHEDEKPAHSVAIPKGFWIGQTEVTNAAYRKLRGRAGGEEALPATGMTWAEAKAWCEAAGGRLPTEAEWEYAARAGNAQPYYGVPSQIAWYAANSGGMRHPAAQKQPNAFGLYDMLGNVAEWVLDRYYNKYDVDAPATGTGIDQPLAGNAIAVARGGFWETEAASLRVSRRGEREPDDGGGAGLRCARDRP